MLTTPQSTTPQFPSLVSADTVVVVHGLCCVVYHDVGHPCSATRWGGKEMSMIVEEEGVRDVYVMLVCVYRVRGRCDSVYSSVSRW